MEKPGRLQSMGLQRVGYDWATSLSFALSYPRHLGSLLCFRHLFPKTCKFVVLCVPGALQYFSLNVSILNSWSEYNFMWTFFSSVVSILVNDVDIHPFPAGLLFSFTCIPSPNTANSHKHFQIQTLVATGITISIWECHHSLLSLHWLPQNKQARITMWHAKGVS